MESFFFFYLVSTNLLPNKKNIQNSQFCHWKIWAWKSSWQINW